MGRSLTSKTSVIGSIIPFGGATAPHGHLLCNGASYSAATYPVLAAVMWNGSAYTYGGSGTFPTGNFNVPDLRDKFPKGRNADALGGTGGSNTMIDHTHGLGSLAINGGSHGHALSGGGNTQDAAPNTFTTGTTGSGHGHTAATLDASPHLFASHVGGSTVGLASIGMTPSIPVEWRVGLDPISTASGTHTHGAQFQHVHNFDISAGSATTSSHGHGTTGAVGSGSAATSTDNRPAYQTVNYVIRAF
jgi:microcystin-dependent protein